MHPYFKVSRYLKPKNPFELPKLFNPTFSRNNPNTPTITTFNPAGQDQYDYQFIKMLIKIGTKKLNEMDLFLQFHCSYCSFGSKKFAIYTLDLLEFEQEEFDKYPQVNVSRCLNLTRKLTKSSVLGVY